MDGRRVSRQNQKYNPLFILFLCLIAAVAILLIVSIVLGVRLGKANKALKAAEAQVESLNEQVDRLQDDLTLAQSRTSSGGGTSAVPDTASSSSSEGNTAAGGSWLDLSGHSEVKVAPTSLLDGYSAYYTTAGVNLRGGPGTNYDRITTVDYGEKVDVAAQQDGWSFVRVGTRFGWINSEYLSKTQPSPQAAAASSTSTSSGTRAEATSGSLRNNSGLRQ